MSFYRIILGRPPRMINHDIEIKPYVVYVLPEVAERDSIMTILDRVINHFYGTNHNDLSLIYQLNAIYDIVPYTTLISDHNNQIVEFGIEVHEDKNSEPYRVMCIRAGEAFNNLDFVSNWNIGGWRQAELFNTFEPERRETISGISISTDNKPGEQVQQMDSRRTKPQNSAERNMSK